MQKNIKDSYVSFSYNFIFSDLLEEIVHNKKFPDNQKPKQLKMPLPKGLLNKTLLDIIYSDKRLNTTKDGWIQIATKECPPYYWSFRPSDSEPSKYDSNYTINPLRQIMLEIIEPIIKNVLRQETPAKWGKEYEEYEKRRLSYFGL
jgi:hypothetical protein